MNLNAKTTESAIAVIILALLLIVVGPLAYIWAWNTLFGSVLTIPMTFWTWLAVAILTSIRVRRSK